MPSLCKTIWLMAVAQHQFYLDRKQSKVSALKFKSLSDCISELNTLPGERLASHSKANARKFP
jgi:hypothetical protein